MLNKAGSYIHVGYGISDNGNLKPMVLDVLDYPKCRKQKEDDDKNDKIFYDFRRSFGAKKERNGSTKGIIRS